MVTKKTSSTTKAETATVKAEKKETAAAKAIETKKDTTKKLETKAAVLVDTPEVQAEEVKETVKLLVMIVSLLPFFCQPDIYHSSIFFTAGTHYILLVYQPIHRCGQRTCRNLHLLFHYRHCCLS